MAGFYENGDSLTVYYPVTIKFVIRPIRFFDNEPVTMSAIPADFLVIYE